jgi:hypothetical protein
MMRFGFRRSSHGHLFGFADDLPLHHFEVKTTFGAGMISRFAVRNFATVLAITLAAGIQAMYGQAAPQLLPYQTSVVAGGGPTYAFTAGGPCPLSTNTSSDIYGDGCLATEVQLNAPKYVTEDAAGNIYFSDNGNALIRKVYGPKATNPAGASIAGIITAVAGGGLLPAPSSTVSNKGVACPSNGSNTASDFQGDGCLATDVKLLNPTGVAVAPITGGVVSAGDILFADAGTYTVRGINSQGVIYNVAGDVQGTYPTYGYIANNPTTPNIIANTQSALYHPYGVHFDSVGNLYIAEEYKDAILVVNTSSATTTVTGINIPAGTIAKIAGFPKTGGGAFCPNGTSGTFGCYGNPWPNNTAASLSALYYPYDVTTDSAGNVYTINESSAAVGQISNTAPFNLNTYAGTQSSVVVTNQRGVATSVPFGTPYGIASDSYGNIYIADSFTGWIWRVDAVGQHMYVLAGAGPLCSTNLDKYGDGCPASGTIFPTGSITVGKLYASSPGLSGLFVDANGTLLVGDTIGNLVHKITTNANFGTIQPLPAQPVQNIEIHFGVGDGPAAYNLTTNPSNFTLGTANCPPANSDGTTDCILPVTANYGNVAGPFSSNLQVVSQLGETGNFTLSGILSLTQASSTTSLKLSSNSTNPVTPITLTATVSTQVSGAPTGTVTFFSNGDQIGTTQNLVNGSASIQYTFPLGTYNVTAEYNGSPYLYGSTSPAPTVTSATPVFNITPATPSMTVAQGQYGLNNLVITTVGGYTGTVSFACSGLPANATCSFSPSSLSVGGTGSSNSTVSLNIVTGATNNASLVKPEIPGISHKMLPFLCILPGAAGMMLLGLGRRKKTRLPVALLMLGMILLAAGFSGCAYNKAATTPTPAGTYNVKVTATGTPNVVSTSTSIVQTSTLTLTVTGY